MTATAEGARPASAAPPYELLPFPERGERRRDLGPAVREFYVDESAALDESRYDEWLGYLDDRFIYQLPVPLLREDPALPRHSDRAMLFEATRGVLAMKLGRVGLHHAWSDRPAAVTRRFVNGVRVFATTDPDELRVDSGVLVTWNRGHGESTLVPAARQDLLRPDGDGFRILRRRVLLDMELPTHEQLSIIF